MHQTAPWLARMAAVATLAALAACQPSTDLAATDRSSAKPALSWRDPQPEVTAPANQPGMPEYLARAAEDRAYAEGRGRDQYQHPGYLALTAPYVAATLASGGADVQIAYDPYRLGWSGTRGQTRDVEFLNRYGAKLRGKFFAPLSVGGPLPTVLFIPGRFIPGADSPYTGFAAYENLLESLAESGYLVFAVGPQGQDGSEWFSPPHAMCEAGGPWTKPQDFGITERGECAGQEGDPEPYRGEFAAIYQGAYELTAKEAPSSGAQAQLEPGVALAQRSDGYGAFETRFVFAAIDGANFLLSPGNPVRKWVDEKRVAIAGHSAGGHAALIVGNGDKRFAAAVMLDSYGLPPDTVSATTPTLIQMAERQNEFGPFDTPPANHLWPPYRAYRRFVAEEVPAMLVALRGSTHHEWSYVPHALTNPSSPVNNESSRGGQVGLYFTLAWLDYWLKPGEREEARSRLLARSFDDSVDVSSIGTGTFDAVTQDNAPYKIAGDMVADHLSVLFRSETNLSGFECEDLQAGCLP